MSGEAAKFEFIGKGRRNALDPQKIKPWGETIGDWIPGEDLPAEPDETARDHPAGYIAQPDLIDAVNTALILRKPLLLTGNPGTGKSQLAERMAWEFNIGPVLRFEAQSLSEAVDLFYRFDLVGHVAASHTARPAELGEPTRADPKGFITFGPLGKAILRSNPAAREHEGLWSRAFPNREAPRAGMPSVVLIDEVDKASRDFPNDLLNAIERLEVPVREIPRATLRVSKDDSLRPIIVITSNSERELPAPFLRRCIYFHIPDPDPDTLRAIVRARVFPETLRTNPPEWMKQDHLPTIFEEMLSFFVEQRDDKRVSLGYASGPSELIDWSRAVREALPPAVAPSGGVKVHESIVTRALGAFAKHRDDRGTLLTRLKASFGSAAS